MLQTSTKKLTRFLKKHWTTIVLAGCLIYLYYAVNEPADLDEDDGASFITLPGSELHNTINKERKCILPELEYMPEPFLPYFQEFIKFGCLPEANWVDVSNGMIIIRDDARKQFGVNGQLECYVTPIYRKNDYISKYDKQAKYKLENSTTEVHHDFIKVECTGADGATYDNLHLTVVPQPNLKPSIQYPTNGLGMDVIIFGFDSVSRINWLRNVPLVHEYFTQQMDGVVMKGYNIVGDGTPQALMPILMGHAELELPEIRKGHNNAKQLDDLPWIWKDFKEAGYVTQWGEEEASIGTFQMRMLGFKDPPVDHYLRPFQIVVEEESGQHPPLCLKSKTRFQYLIDYIRELYEAYPHIPKISFMFSSTYTHDKLNRMKIAEKELLTFIKQISLDEKFSNTMLILMSDHGQRTFPALRQLLQGKYEERMPYLGISLPKRIRDKYPDLLKNLKSNVGTLTSPFDFHETLKDVIHFDAKTINTPHILKRGMSLFREIPKDRTCTQAQIAPHWCTCLRWTQVDNDNDNARAAVWALIQKINELTQDHRDKCEELYLSKIIKVEMYAPNPKLIRFIANVDKDGRIPEFDDTIESGVDSIYQVTVQTTRNDGLYEATVTVKARSNYVVDTSQISRINRYNNGPHCIIDTFPHLRPYCFCKNHIH